MTPPALADLLAAQRRIAPYILRTPLLRHDALDAVTGAHCFVKAESLQRFGAFKARGAFNAIAALGARGRAGGVVAFSSGNHAQAVAGAARAFGVRAAIVMPADAPAAKIENTRALGGEVILYDRVKEDREAIGLAIAGERNAPIIRPFDDPMVIAGQGTAGLEIAEDLSEQGLRADVVLVCASGGGLVSGVGLAMKAHNPGAAIVAVEPAGHDDFARSLAAGARLKNPPGVRSICDALLTESPGVLAYQIATAYGFTAHAVTDDQVKDAMRFAFRHLRLVLEPGGAAALAAGLSGGMDLSGKTVAIVASGGNVDAALFSEVLALA